MATKIQFEDGTEYPWPDNPSEKDYAAVEEIQAEIDSLKNDVKGSIGDKTLKSIEKFGWEAVLPTTGALVGTFGGPYAPVTVPAGALFGTWLNQQLGITEKNYLDLVLSAAIPGAVAPTKGVLKGTIKRLPGSAAAMNEMVLAKAYTIPGKYAPRIPSTTLFKKAGALGQTFDGKKITQTITRALRKEARAANPDKNLIKYLSNIKEKINLNRGALKADDFHEEMVRLYQDNQAAFNKGDKAVQHLGEVYNAFRQTLDDAAKLPASSPSAIELKRAIQTYKSEKAIERIGAYLQKAQIAGEASDFHTINAKSVVNSLLKDENFKTAFTPEIRADIIKIIKSMTKVPKEIGLGFRAAVGAGLGVAIPFTASPGMNIAMGAGGYEVFGYVLSSEGGRNLLKRLLKEDGGRLTTNSLAVLATYLDATVFQTPVPEKKQEIKQNVRKRLKNLPLAK